jgi:uncharacterized protein
MVHARLATTRMKKLARQFPAVGILGPRQAGKTTLARLAFPGWHAVDLEDPVDFDRLRADPRLLLAEHDRIIIDEAQRMPELFAILRAELDRRPKLRVALLGSASPRLVRGVSESLTGRIGWYELAGLSVLEADASAVWTKGGFPRVHWSRPRSQPAEWYPAWLRTSLEQDLPQLVDRVSPQRARALLTLIANGQGTTLSMSELGAPLGVSYHTVGHLLDLLEGVFLVRRLPPFFANIKKRIVKSPKLYVRDTGLLHSLLGMGFTRKSVLGHPKAGASFETHCIEQILQHARLHDPAAEAFFFRTHTGVEIDLLLSLRGRLVPIEVKLGLGPPDVRGIEAGMKELGLTRGYVVYAGDGARELRRGLLLVGLVELLTELRIGA